MLCAFAKRFFERFLGEVITSDEVVGSAVLLCERLCALRRSRDLAAAA